MTAAGLAALGAGVFFGLSMALLIVFFVTKNEQADRWSERSFLVFFVLAAVVIYEIHRRYVDRSPLVWVATIAGLAGMAVSFVLELLVTARRVEFTRVAPLLTGGFVVFILWLLAASAMILAFGGLPAELGWLGVVAVVVAIGVIGWLVRDPAMMKGERSPTQVEMALSVVPFIGVIAWLVWLGLNLL